MDQFFKTSVLIVNYNTADFIELSLYALKQLSKHPYKVYILDNNSNIKDYRRLVVACNRYDNVFVERHETYLIGSIAHGTALNHLLKNVDTEYFSILDADAIWLKKNWDDILISNLTDQVKVIGTQAGGLKPKDFPLMFCILFETKVFKSLHIDFRPKDKDKKQDTGWEIREKYLNAGYQGKIIELLLTRTYKKGPYKDIIAGEYYFNSNYDEIFASHFGRGASLGAAKYLKGKYLYIYKIPYIGKLLLQIKGIKEKEQWIKISRKIITRQTTSL